jgi:Fe2+ or Zn2+ uptake regulation protein
MSTTSSETNRTDNEDALWLALNTQPMATTAELSAAAGIAASSVRRILARWTEDNTVTRHADDSNGPHRWTVTATDTFSDAAPSPVPDTAAAGAAPAPQPAAPDTDTDTQDTDIATRSADTPPAEPATSAVSPADAPAASELAPEAADDATQDDTDQDEMPDDEDEDESPFGEPCPIAVGDEVANRYHRSWRGRVTEMQCQDGIAQCIIETSDDAQSSIPPWALVPAGPDGVPDEWQQQMDTLVAAQRDRAVHQLQDRSTAAREHLEYLAGRLNGIATALDTGTASHDDNAAPMATSVGELEDAMLELNDFRSLVIDSGLLTVDEIKRATARPASTRPNGTRPAATASNHSVADKLPPGGLRGMVEDALHDNPGRSFTTTEIKHVLDQEYQRNISSGAISNALDKLTEQGVARRICDTPRTWARAENP